MSNIPDQLQPEDLIEYSPDLDDLLSRNPQIPIREEPKRRLRTMELLRTDRVTSMDVLWAEARRQRTTALHNDPKIGLASDLAFDSSGNVDEVRIWRTDYFTGVLTNERTRHDYQLSGRGEKTIALSASDYVNEQVLQKGALLKTSSLSTSPHLGVNVLAVGPGSIIPILQQAGGLSQSSLLLAPSGSGSMDWADYQDLPEFRRYLIDLIEVAAARELREELTPTGEPLMGGEVRMQIIGYFRWVGRACLPGFLAVANCAELDVRRSNTTEGFLHTNSMSALETRDAIGLAKFAGGLLSRDRSVDGMAAPPLSVPLIALLEAVRRWTASDPSAVASLLTTDK